VATAATAATAAIILGFMLVAVTTAAFVVIIVTMTATALVIITVAMTAAALVIIIVTTTTAASVFITELAMSMTMGDFFGAGRTHFAYRNLETQIDTRQRMVGIDLDEVFGDFNDGHRTVAIIGIGNEGIAFGNVHAIKQFTRHALYQLFVVLAVCIGSIDVQFEGITDGTVIQRLFQTWNQKAGPVQINQRLAAFGAVQYIAGLVIDGVIESNNAQMAYFHVSILKLAPLSQRQKTQREKLQPAYRKTSNLNTPPG
jgi:hypothetical protein